MHKFAKVAAVSFAAILSATATMAVDERYIDGDAVVGGYDVVAYHTMGKPTEGSSEFSAEYQGATWHLASAENLELLNSDPAKYATSYGGWCSAGASKGKKVSTMPDPWAIVDGQLYLNSSPAGRNDLFLADSDLRCSYATIAVVSESRRSKNLNTSASPVHLSSSMIRSTGMGAD